MTVDSRDTTLGYAKIHTTTTAARDKISVYRILHNGTPIYRVRIDMGGDEKKRINVFSAANPVQTDGSVQLSSTVVISTHGIKIPNQTYTSAVENRYLAPDGKILYHTLLQSLLYPDKLIVVDTNDATSVKQNYLLTKYRAHGLYGIKNNANFAKYREQTVLTAIKERADHGDAPLGYLTVGKHSLGVTSQGVDAVLSRLGTTSTIATYCRQIAGTPDEPKNQYRPIFDGFRFQEDKKREYNFVDNCYRTIVARIVREYNQQKHLLDAEQKTLDSRKANYDLIIKVKSELLDALDPTKNTRDVFLKNRNDALKNLSTKQSNLEKTIAATNLSIQGIKNKYSTSDSWKEISAEDVSRLAEEERKRKSLTEDLLSVKIEISINQQALNQFQQTTGGSFSPADLSQLQQKVTAEIERVNQVRSGTITLYDQSKQQIQSELTSLRLKNQKLIAVIQEWRKTHKKPDVTASSYASKGEKLTGTLGLGRASEALSNTIRKADSSVNSKLGIGSGSLGVFSIATDITGSIGEDASQKTTRTASKALVGIGAVAGVGAETISLALAAKQLNNPHLSDSQRKLLQAEVGLQGAVTGLAALEGSLWTAQAAAQAGSKAASVLGKAIPVVGSLGAIAGAINPAKWAEFDAKQGQIDQLKKSDNYSASMLANLLTDSLTTEKGFYGATTALDALTGIAGAGLAATGVGAGVGVAVGLVGTAVSMIVQAFEQVALNEIADEYRQKMLTDKNGKKRSIEEFFQGSFHQQQKKSRQAYQEHFQDLVTRKGYDNVFAFGSQTLTETDLRLAGFTRTGGELNQTARHYFDQYRQGGTWDENLVDVVPKKGQDRVLLPSSDKENSYVTFITPLLASGKEETNRTKTGKDEYTTKLKIQDINGWSIEDQGNRNSTFNLSKLVTSAQAVKGGKIVEIDADIKGAGGKDTFFIYDSSVNIDGGTGQDRVSYGNLEREDQTRGLTIDFDKRNSSQILVTKHLSQNADQYKETIKSISQDRGKETDIIQYREIVLGKRGQNAQVKDKLSNIEILRASELGDSINLRGLSAIDAIYGGGGDDEFRISESFSGALFGNQGVDKFDLNNVSFDGQGTKIPYINGGGAGGNSLIIDQQTWLQLADWQSEEILRSATADFLAKSFATPGIDSEKTARSFKALLSNGAKVKPLLNVEEITLVEIPIADWSLLPDKAPHQTGENLFKTAALNGEKSSHRQNYYLQEYVDILTGGVLGDKFPEGFDEIVASAAQLSKGVNFIGSNKRDKLRGSAYGDFFYAVENFNYIWGAGGHDVYVGGKKSDIYNFDGQNFGHDLIYLFDPQEASQQRLTFRDVAYRDMKSYRYDQDLIIRISDQSSVTIKDAYKLGLLSSNPPAKNFSSSAQGDSSALQTVLDYFNHKGVASWGQAPSAFRHNYFEAMNSTPIIEGAKMASSRATDKKGFINEILKGPTNGDDVLHGTPKNDQIKGFGGNDIMKGDDGNDSLRGGPGRDQMYGDNGDDTLWAGNDNYGDVMHGGNGNDHFHGSRNHDQMYGDDGKDSFHGTRGFDRLDGGDGYDTADYSQSNYTKGIISFSRLQTVQVQEQSGADIDTLVGIERLIATEYNDRLYAPSNGMTSSFHGLAGDDYMEGDVGNEMFSGGRGNDTLNGAGGRDMLYGGMGINMVTGGLGADIFYFEEYRHGTTTIKDFDPAEGDKIGLNYHWGQLIGDYIALDKSRVFSFNNNNGILSFRGKQFAILENVNAFDVSTDIEFIPWNSEPEIFPW